MATTSASTGRHIGGATHGYGASAQAQHRPRSSSTHSAAKSKRRASPPPPAEVRDSKTGKRYSRGRFLGKGGFARCYEMVDKDSKEIFAGKVVPKRKLVKPHAKEKLASEVKIHKALSHKRVVGFYSFFEDEHFVYILLELCDNKSLMEMHKKRRALTEPEVRYFIKQIIEATEYMHYNKVIHRDLKLGNLFLNENMDIKVGDFGLATRVRYDGERKKTMCGTPNYIAPEILHGKDGHSFEVDVWSIGCILYTLLVGRPPFETQNLKLTYSKIQNNDYKIPSTIPMSDAAKDLIRATLSGDPARRPSLEQIRNHPFLTQFYIPSALPVSALTIPPTFDTKHVTAKTFASGSSSTSKTPSSIAYGLDRTPLRTLSSNTAAASSLPSASKASTRQHRQLPQPHTQQQPQLRRPSAPSVGSAALQAAAAAAASRSQKSTTTAAAVTTRMSSAGAGGAGAGERKDSLQFIYRRIKQVVSEQALASSTEPPAPISTTAASNGLWVTKWVDYSNKYGLGYQLSDGSCGVLFNDTTKMVLSPDQHHVESIERDASGNVVTLLTLTDYPKELDKKVTLLKYFHDYMREHLLNSGDQEAAKASYSSNSLSHVRRWIRTKHGIVFRISNGVIQINFFDHTKLIVNVPNESLSFINKARNTLHYRLNDIASSSSSSIKDLVSRLGYSADVVNLILTNAAAATSVEPEKK